MFFIPSIIFFLSLVLIPFLSPDPLFAQCQVNDRNQGLISATEGIGTNTKFGSLDQVCITDTKDASYRLFKVPDYQNLEDEFYNHARSYKKGTDSLPSSGTIDFTGPRGGNGIYLQTGDMTINSLANGSGNQVIFIKGKLTITGDITYAESDPDSGLVFIVQGGINIGSSVTQVNAVLISGVICTAYDSLSQACLGGSTTTPQLKVNGSLISLNKTDLSFSPIMLRRNLLVNDVPAEIINKQPKYLYNLRGGLFTRDLIITTEDANYDITATPIPTPSSGPGSVTCDEVPNPFIIAIDRKGLGCIKI